MSEERTKPSDIAMAELSVMQRAMEVCARMKGIALQERLLLLHAGFPVAHILCQELDHTAAFWAAHQEAQRRAILTHAEENQIQL